MATFNERMARAFMQEGHNVTIFSFSLQYPNFLFPGSTQYSNEAPPKDLKIYPVINSINPFNWIKTGKRIKNLKPDLIVVRYWLPFMAPCLGTILRIIKKNKFSKIVCIADNVIPHEKGIGDKFLTKYFVKPVDSFITMSENVFKDLKTFTSKHALIIQHPLYDNFGLKISKKEAREKLSLDKEEKIILFFGFIRKYKGLDILLDAMAILKNKSSASPYFKMPKLLVAGEFYGSSKPYLDQIENLGLGDYLILRTKFIPDNEVRNYFCAADVIVQPYRDATQSGVSPLAYHFEIPMIVTNVGGLPALVPDGVSGLVAEPDAQSISAAIFKFLSLEEGYFTSGLQEEKKKYSWKKLVDAIIN
ncbi:MAG: glycosyltransferase [Ferruginibacter sp.]